MILIVDDDIAVQTSLSLLLKQTGFLPVCTSNPGEAEEKIKEQYPEAVILDLNFGNDTSGKEGRNFLTGSKRNFRLCL